MMNNSGGIFNSSLVMLSGYLAGLLIGLGIAVLIGAIMLRIAAKVLRFPSIPFESAFYATAVSAITMFSIQFTGITSYFSVIGVAMQGQAFARSNNSLLASLAYSLNPTFITLAGTIAAMLSALLYQRLLSFEDQFDEHDNPIKFKLNLGDAIILAAVQIGATMLCGFLLSIAFACSLLVLTNFG